ncbi:hypothetical protein GCM10010954_23950 [Halobacillus andaensis]|uniref:Uncharacterized protein n=1 Tax=Halobacillus andaensis TaxID=1176239 RepID=A0A917EW96_HALAA|nr:hypothetical protein [Halobacillus andaensis]MBP2006015.1 hypothetical protein [Halobacillus andaensis]GGF24278.1 hypothetical protein GCM10010954_23950 [Halobacillus andaensis]
MRKNFLNDFKTKQEVVVFDGYHIYKDATKIKGLSLGNNNGEMIGRLLEKRGIEKDFKELSLDLTFNSLRSDLELWANYLELPLEELEVKLFDRTLSYEELITKDPLIIGINEKSTSQTKNYKFETAKSLYTELAKLTPFDFKSLIKFSKVFGLPYGLQEDILEQHSSPDINVQIPFTDIYYLFYELTIYRYYFSLFEAIIFEDTNKIKSLLERHHNIIAQMSNTTIDNITTAFSIAIEHDDSLIYSAKELLTEHFHNNHRALQILPDFEDGKIIPKIFFKDLFEYAYFQMLNALMNNSELRKCEYCNHVFEVDFEGRRFCPPLPFRKRSSCEMAYNRMKKKQKKGDS